MTRPSLLRHLPGGKPASTGASGRTGNSVAGHRARRRRQLLLEWLEPRVLLSATRLGDDASGAVPDVLALSAQSWAPAAVEEVGEGEMSAAALPLIFGDALVLPGAATVAAPVAAPMTAAADGGTVAGQTPYGAAAADGSEFMLGDVWVTVTLLESDGGIDPQTENWSASRIATVENEIREGLGWWESTLAARFPASPHTLDFHIDFTYADSPVATGYEPITRPQSDEGLWINSFLDRVGYNTSAGYGDDLARWNNDRRTANNCDWAFTVFVVDSLADSNGMFSDGYFAYAYLGGPFAVMTYDNDGWGIGRMGQVLAHETGHIFYALDEYSGSSAYSARAGYYSSQNFNAYDGNPNVSSRVPSLMAESSLQNTAYPQYTSSPSSLAMLGWQDSDGDGIFDVLDVPLTLTGSGEYNVAAGRYEFVGTSSVGALTNLNPYGRSHDVTINTVDRIQYRLDGGVWVDGNAYGGYVQNVAQNVPATLAGTHTIDFRTIVAQTGVTSPVWSGTFQVPGTPSVPPILVHPLADVSVNEDAANTVINLAGVFDDPDLASGDHLTYTATVSASVWDVLAEINQASYTHIHQDLLYTHLGDNRGFGPEHDLARDNITGYLTSLGLATSLHPFTYSGQTYYNVAATKPGATRPNDIYVVGAHYDSVNNPGADDNASGTAAVLELARALSQYSFDATLTFLLFDREEQGLIGSQAYAAAAQARGDTIRGMVNLDMVAYNPGGANLVRIYDGDGQDEELKQDLLEAFNVFHYGGVLTAADGGWTNRSDHASFDARGYDAAMIIEGSWASNPYYHQASDAVETSNYVDYAFATGVTSAAAGYLVTAAGVRQPSTLVTASVQGNQLVLDWAADGNGTASVTVRAVDLAGGWAEDTFAIGVSDAADGPSVARPLEDVSVLMNAANTTISLRDRFADVDLVPSADWLTYSVAGNTNPALAIATITDSDLVLNYQPSQSGTAQITIRATDRAGLYVEDTLQVTVQNVVVTTRIIDNGDAGFSTAAGSFAYYTSAGSQAIYGYFQDDTHYHAAGSGQNRVQWTFSGLTPGAYQVATTWGPYSNRASNAPYTVQGNGSGDVLVTKAVDQRQSPSVFSGSFTDQGVPWAMLSSVYVLGAGGTTITVQLTDQANNYVMADAVRIAGMTAASPEIDVQQGGVSLTDGTSTVDLGKTDVGVPVSRTFVIRNTGGSNLTVGATLSLPSGFVLASADPATLFNGSSSTTLVAGGQATFTVRFNAATAGVSSGTLSFSSNDADENPFNFTLSAEAVVSAELDVQQDGVSLTDGLSTLDFGQTDVGVPVSRTLVIRNVGGNDLTLGATLSLPSGFSLAGAVPATLFNGSSSTTLVAGGQAVFTVRFNAATAGVSIGTLSFSSNDADENPFNFTVRGEAAAVAEIDVQQGGVSLTDGTSTVDLGKTDVGVPVSRTFVIRNVGDNNLTVGPTLSLPSGFVLAGADPATLFNGSSSTTIAAAGQATFTVRFPAVAAGVFSGMLSFNSNDADENPFNFTLRAEAAAAGQPVIIDNGEAGFSTAAGSFLYYTSAGAQSTYGYFRDDTHYHAAGSGQNKVQWTFSGLTAGTYQVATTWGPYPNRASNAPYTVQGNGSGSVLVTKIVDQRQSPSAFSGAFTDQGVPWAILSSAYVLGAGGTTITVQLTDQTNNYVMADAVRLVKVSPLLAADSAAGDVATPPLSQTRLQSAAAAALSQWFAQPLTVGQRQSLESVNFYVDDLPGMMLGGATPQTVVIDVDAAGYGWLGERPGVSRQPSVATMDLVSVIAHELGHVLGLEHADQAGGLMSATLPAGVRRLPLPGNDGMGDLLSLGSLWSDPVGVQREAAASWMSAFVELGGALGQIPTAEDREAFDLLRRDREPAGEGAQELSEAALLTWADDDEADDVLVGLRRSDEEKHSNRVDSVFEASDDWNMAPSGWQTEDRPRDAGKR